MMPKDKKTKNIQIFQHTVEKYTYTPKLQESIKESLKGQDIYFAEEDMAWPDIPELYDTNILVSMKRTMEAASTYAKNKEKVCILNFASATNPGGGVTKGSNAQEECLCRISTLYATLNTKQCWDAFYGPHRALHNPINSLVLSATFNKSLYNDDCIYTPNITVFKTDTQEPMLLPEEDWYQVDVITCAAPNLREHPSNQYNPGSDSKPSQISNEELLRLHIERGRRILQVAKTNGAEVVILGAFGCGAFQNPPEVVAEAYKQLLEEYNGWFKTIEFAVYCSSHDKTNYEVFKEILSPQNMKYNKPALC